MDGRDFNWNDLKFFIALVRGGTPAAAGRLLRVDHNTVRRRVAALEADLNTRLFDHRSDEQALTGAGKLMLKLAECVELRIERERGKIFSQDLAISGTVRVGVPDGLGTLFVAPRLALLRARHPNLRIELVLTSRRVDLSKREADVAIVIDRPTAGRMVISKLVDVTMRLYATREYLDRKPAIGGLADLAGHDFISGVDGLDFGASLNSQLDQAGALSVEVVCTSSVAQLKAAAAGAGLALFSRFLAQTEPALEAVLPHQVGLVREIWLAQHSELRELARVKAVADFLREQFTAAAAEFA